MSGCGGKCLAGVGTCASFRNWLFGAVRLYPLKDQVHALAQLAAYWLNSSSA